MAENIVLEYAGKDYLIKPKKLTGALLDQVTPIREKMIERAQAFAVNEAIGEDTTLLELIEIKQTDAGNRIQLTDNVPPDVLKRALRANPALAKAMLAPTAKLHTDAVGRHLMSQLFAMTVDRSNMPEQLSVDIDSPSIAEPAVIDAEGNETKGEQKVSTFWSEVVDLNMLITYCEHFCRIARI